MSQLLDFSWLSMSPFQAQALSYVAIALFGVTFFLLIFGLLVKLSPRGTHLLALSAFSGCTFLGLITTIIYYWHHYLRIV